MLLLKFPGISLPDGFVRFSEDVDLDLLAVFLQTFPSIGLNHSSRCSQVFCHVGLGRSVLLVGPIVDPALISLFLVDTFVVLWVLSLCFVSFSIVIDHTAYGSWIQVRRPAFWWSFDPHLPSKILSLPSQLLSDISLASWANTRRSRTCLNQEGLINVWHKFHGLIRKYERVMSGFNIKQIEVAALYIH